MRKIHRRVLVVLMVLLLGAPAVGVPGGLASSAQGLAAAHPAAAAASFALDPALTKVTNPNAAELTITPTVAGQAIDDHTGANGGAGNGGDWKVEYHWAVPPKLVPGKPAAIYLQIIVDSENPPQPNGYQMGALAPNFAQSLPCHYPEQSSCSKTFVYPFLADEAGASDIVVSVGMLSASVDFHYKPVGSSTPPRAVASVCSMAHPRAANCIPIPSNAIRPAGASEQGGPRSPAGVPVPPGERARGAVDWALAQKGVAGWTLHCEGFVESAYGTRGEFQSAGKLAASLKLQRGPAPSGALVFFRADWGNKYGHVGISLGGNRMISALAKVATTDIAKSPYWTHQYLGWSYAPPSWPGRAPTNP